VGFFAGSQREEQGARCRRLGVGSAKCWDNAGAAPKSMTVQILAEGVPGGGHW
jgi:hypothetical protein